MAKMWEPADVICSLSESECSESSYMMGSIVQWHALLECISCALYMQFRIFLDRTCDNLHQNGLVIGLVIGHDWLTSAIPGNLSMRRRCP